jgi:hypothetical protein
VRRTRKSGEYRRIRSRTYCAGAIIRANIRGIPIKISTKVVSDGRYVTFQMSEVAVSGRMFKEILMLIAQLRVPPSQREGQCQRTSVEKEKRDE